MRQDKQRAAAKLPEAQAASATECTGLVPALTDAAGEDAERALYDVRRAKRPGKMPGK